MTLLLLLRSGATVELPISRPAITGVPIVRVGASTTSRPPVVGSARAVVTVSSGVGKSDVTLTAPRSGSGTPVTIPPVSVGLAVVLVPPKPGTAAPTATPPVIVGAASAVAPARVGVASPATSTPVLGPGESDPLSTAPRVGTASLPAIGGVSRTFDSGTFDSGTFDSIPETSVPGIRVRGGG